MAGGPGHRSGAVAFDVSMLPRQPVLRWGGGGGNLCDGDLGRDVGSAHELGPHVWGKGGEEASHQPLKAPSLV